MWRGRHIPGAPAWWGRLVQRQRLSPGPPALSQWCLGTREGSHSETEWPDDENSVRLMQHPAVVCQPAAQLLSGKGQVNRRMLVEGENEGALPDIVSPRSAKSCQWRTGAGRRRTHTRAWGRRSRRQDRRAYRRQPAGATTGESMPDVGHKCHMNA